MPTASTSQILGNNECFEPYTSNLYTRRVLSGEFIVVNKHLLRDLVKLGIWNENLKQQIIAHNGSIQEIEEIPASHPRTLQNRVGNQAKNTDRYGRRSGGFHLSIALAQSFCAYPHLCQTDLHAFLCLEERT